jgi:hypothetical protein
MYRPSRSCRRSNEAGRLDFLEEIINSGKHGFVA